MKPIVLIHGYSAESEKDDPASIKTIYGDLPDYLRQTYAGQVVEIDVSRYISLNDAVTVQDIARALDRALHTSYPQLLQSGFNVIIHSTGALVIRNWLKMFSPKPSPVSNLIHLAGANFGSGWAIIGQGQLARWGRYVFERGSQRGVKVLQALELGSSQTLDVHLHFTTPGNLMLKDYQVQEYIIIGTQADASWYEFPVRYAKEDGSDGTVRVSAGNLNFNYLSLTPTEEAFGLSWGDVQTAIANANSKQPFPAYYAVSGRSLPQQPNQQFSETDRPEIPFAIPFNCAHTGDASGIVSGAAPKEQVRRLIDTALRVPDRSPSNWAATVAVFHKETGNTYDQARSSYSKSVLNFLADTRSQYDAHAQVVVRLHDQDGNPIAVDNADIFFVSEQQRAGTVPIQSLIENTVVSDVSPNCITFFLRVNHFDTSINDWRYQLQFVADFALEITAIEPATPNQSPSVAYVPLRLPLSAQTLARFIEAHRTTVLDVQLVRLPSPEVYKIAKV